MTKQVKSAAYVDLAVKKLSQELVEIEKQTFSNLGKEYAVKELCLIKLKELQIILNSIK